MSSTAVATFNFTNLKGALPPADTDVGIITVLKKRAGDTTLSFAFSDASLKDPKAGQGIILGAEATLKDGVKGNLTYDVHKRTGMASMTLDKSFDSGSNLQLKAIYKQAGDMFILEETWKLDANNKLGGHYNFNTEEAAFSYTYTKDDWAATGRYNFQKDTTVLEVEKKEGKNKYSVMYAPKDGATALIWTAKPFKAVLKGNVGKGGVSANSATLAVTHEFDL